MSRVPPDGGSNLPGYQPISLASDEVLSDRVTLLSDLYGLVAHYDPPASMNVDFLDVTLRILRATTEDEFFNVTRQMLDLKAKLDATMDLQHSAMVRAAGEADVTDRELCETMGRLAQLEATYAWLTANKNRFPHYDTMHRAIRRRIMTEEGDVKRCAESMARLEDTVDTKWRRKP